MIRLGMVRLRMVRLRMVRLGMVRLGMVRLGVSGETPLRRWRAGRSIVGQPQKRRR